MHTPSTRMLASLAYERGEEFDPALTPSAAWWGGLALGKRAVRPLESVAPCERRRRASGSGARPTAACPAGSGPRTWPRPPGPAAASSTASPSSSQAEHRWAAAPGLASPARRGGFGFGVR
jgi:hypothetical protein